MKVSCGPLLSQESDGVKTENLVLGVVERCCQTMHAALSMELPIFGRYEIVAKGQISIRALTLEGKLNETN